MKKEKGNLRTVTDPQSRGCAGDGRPAEGRRLEPAPVCGRKAAGASASSAGRVGRTERRLAIHTLIRQTFHGGSLAGAVLNARD